MATEETINKELVTEDTSWMDALAGSGFDEMDSKACSTSYLSMVQPDSAAEDENNPAGTWRNTSTGDNYGNVVSVVVLDFKVIWNERDRNAPYNTVGRYEPGSIKVDIRQPAKGRRGYPEMINPETGNTVQELFVYAVILPDHPEAGVLYFNPTIGSMKTCRSWNSALRSQILKNGARAPIFGYKWNLVTETVPNPQQPSKSIARFTKFSKDAIVNEALYSTSIKPQLTAVKQSVALLATDDESDIEE